MPFDPDNFDDVPFLEPDPDVQARNQAKYEEGFPHFFQGSDDAPYGPPEEWEDNYQDEYTPVEDDGTEWELNW
jgi:hypothetical protein